MSTIGYAGMSHLGVVSAIAAAAKGFPVVAFDMDSATIAMLDAGRLPVNEPGLQALLEQGRANLKFSADPLALAGCDLVYVSQDVPTDDAGDSDLGLIERLLATLHAALPPMTSIVILSQVQPGFTRAHAMAGRSLFYQVETLIFGRAVERAMTPERFIVGAGASGIPLPDALRRFLAAFGCPILALRYESAELAKIAINCFLVSSVTTTNMLAELCEEIGADWEEIAPTLRLDRRIGPYAYLQPGLGIAGGNLERDLATVRRLSTAARIPTAMTTTWSAESARRRDWPLRVLERHGLPTAESRVAIVGLAYKENTHSTKNSPGLHLAERLAAAELMLHDPVVDTASICLTLPRAVPVASALDACRGADAVCLMTPWPAFREIDLAALASVMRGRLIVDPYALLRSAQPARHGLRYHTLGSAPDQDPDLKTRT